MTTKTQAACIRSFGCTDCRGFVRTIVHLWLQCLRRVPEPLLLCEPLWEARGGREAPCQAVDVLCAWGMAMY